MRFLAFLILQTPSNFHSLSGIPGPNLPKIRIGCMQIVDDSFFPESYGEIGCEISVSIVEADS